MSTSNTATTPSIFLWLVEVVNAMADFGLYGGYKMLSFCDTWAAYTASLYLAVFNFVLYYSLTHVAVRNIFLLR